MTTSTIKPFSSSLLDAVMQVRGSSLPSVEKKETVADAYSKEILESEQLDELSQDKLYAYGKANRKDPAREKKRGAKSKETKARLAKREKGLVLQSKALDKIRAQEYAKKHKDYADVVAHVRAQTPAILQSHGYTKVADGDKKSTWVKPHSSGNILTASVHHPKEDETNFDVHHMTLGRSMSYTSSNDRHKISKYSKDKFGNMNTKKDAIEALHNHLRNHEKEVDENSKDRWYESVSFDDLSDVLTEEEIANLESIVEEIENLDELKSSTLKSYMKKARADVEDKEDEGDYENYYGNHKDAKQSFNQAGKRKAKISLAKMKIRRKEDDANEAQNRADRLKRMAQEEYIDEGRGKRGRLKQANKPTNNNDEWETEGRDRNKNNFRKTNQKKYVYDEETEINELSNKTLKSYQRKSATDSDRQWAKADKEEDKSMSTDGMKYPEKQQRHMDNASKAIERWRKREAGLKMVDKKLKR